MVGCCGWRRQRNAMQPSRRTADPCRNRAIPSFCPPKTMTCLFLPPGPAFRTVPPAIRLSLPVSGEQTQDTVLPRKPGIPAGVPRTTQPGRGQASLRAGHGKRATATASPTAAGDSRRGLRRTATRIAECAAMRGCACPVLSGRHATHALPLPGPAAGAASALRARPQAIRRMATTRDRNSPHRRSQPPAPSAAWPRRTPRLPTSRPVTRHRVRQRGLISAATPRALQHAAWLCTGKGVCSLRRDRLPLRWPIPTAHPCAAGKRRTISVCLTFARSLMPYERGP